MRLKNVNVSLFETYITRLYTGILEFGGDDPTSPKNFDTLGEAAQMGDFLDDRKFSNMLVDGLLVFLTRPGGSNPPATTLHRAYEMLPRNSGYCRLLVTHVFRCYESSRVGSKSTPATSWPTL